jgi:hypothetical protein
MTYLGNAFALSMVDGDCKISIRLVDMEEVTEILSKGFTSVVGHASTAELYSSLLKMEIVVNRVTTLLNKNDILIVGQYSGPRLEEGAISLPENASIIWKEVFLISSE